MPTRGATNLILKPRLAAGRLYIEGFFRFHTTGGARKRSRPCFPESPRGRSSLRPATEAVNAAIKITGSYGCYREQPFEMWLRDVKSLEIAGGTPEIMKNIIADQILGRVKTTQ